MQEVRMIFLQMSSSRPIALGFIDGEHTYEQVKKDFWNIYKLLVEGGYIFLHDTYPLNEDYLTPTTCGDVYKFRQELEVRSHEVGGCRSIYPSSWSYGCWINDGSQTSY